MQLSPLQALVLTAAVLGGCRSGPSGVPRRFEAHEVPAALVDVQRELAEGDTRRALARARRASEVRGLEPELRSRAARLLDAAARARLADLSEPGSDPRDLKEMLELELPRQTAVRAGVRAAELYFEDGERQKAFELIQRVDTSYPHHFDRLPAGKVVADVGFSFAEDGGRYGLFFKYRSLAFPVLHYLVDTYPSEPRGDLAYATLARLYEEDGRWDFAIENHEDLILWYPDSPLTSASEASIPRLRLVGLASPEFDRTRLEQAEREFLAWLDGHALSHPLVEQVRGDLADCRRRMADSDLSVAHFYIEVENDEGAEFHTRRALREALEGLDEDQIAEARALLADLVGDGSSGAAP